MVLKLTKNEVEELLRFVGEAECAGHGDALSNVSGLSLCLDWLTLESEKERLSEALAGMDCQDPVFVPCPRCSEDAPCPDVQKDCGKCEPCKERAKREKP